MKPNFYLNHKYFSTSVGCFANKVMIAIMIKRNIFIFCRVILRKENLSLRRLIFISGISQFGVNMFTFFFNSKMFLWTRRMQFCNPDEVLWLEVCKISIQRPKKVYKSIFCSKKYFPSKFSSGRVECSFDNPNENFLLKDQCFFLTPEKNDIISKTFPKMFLWTSRKQL